MDQCPDRGYLSADDPRAGDQGAQPVVKSMISGPAMPGKRYLFPPEKPTTSCGKTGHQIDNLIVRKD